MPLIIPNKFATRVGSIQLAEMDDNFQYLASEFDRISVGITVSGTAVLVNGNLTVTGTPIGPTASPGTSNTQLATTAFVASAISTAVASSIPTGVITMWSGSIISIPIGWRLCDGTNGTPDLRDRFVVGVGTTYSPGNTGGSKDATLVAHSHTASSSVSDPGHAHGISDPSHRHSDRMSVGHDDNNGTNGQDAAINLRQSSDAPVLSYYGTTEYSTTGITINNAGVGISVSTTLTTTGSSATNANLPPYYALCFIMKT